MRSNSQHFCFIIFIIFNSVIIIMIILISMNVSVNLCAPRLIIRNNPPVPIKFGFKENILLVILVYVMVDIQSTPKGGDTCKTCNHPHSSNSLFTPRSRGSTFLLWMWGSLVLWMWGPAWRFIRGFEEEIEGVGYLS